MTAITLSPSRRAACQETYADVEKLIWKIVNKFVALRGGDPDEAFADASCHFMRAYTAPTYDPTRTRFSTWLWHVVWNGLASDRAREVRNAERFGAAGSMDDAPAGQSVPFNRENLMARLSSDARTVLRLVLDAPAEIVEATAGLTKDGGLCRRAIRGWLAGMGWGVARISEAFSEIAEAL